MTASNISSVALAGRDKSLSQERYRPTYTMRHTPQCHAVAVSQACCLVESWNPTTNIVNSERVSDAYGVYIFCWKYYPLPRQNDL